MKATLQRCSSFQEAQELTTLAEKLSHRVAQARLASSAPILVPLCGPQVPGKSTLAGEVERILGAQGLYTVVLSIDDFYLTRAERSELARRIHPLLAIRGPPGTHDVGFALEVVTSLLQGCPVVVPRFLKGADDRCAPDSFDPEHQVAAFLGLPGCCQTNGNLSPVGAALPLLRSVRRPGPPTPPGRRTGSPCRSLGR